MTVNEEHSAKNNQVLASTRTKNSSGTEIYESKIHAKPSHVFWIVLSTPYALESTTLPPQTLPEEFYFFNTLTSP
jgi:hypothetical protein